MIPCACAFWAQGHFRSSGSPAKPTLLMGKLRLAQGPHMDLARTSCLDPAPAVSLANHAIQNGLPHWSLCRMLCLFIGEHHPCSRRVAFQQAEGLGRPESEASSLQDSAASTPSQQRKSPWAHHATTPHSALKGRTFLSNQFSRIPEGAHQTSGSAPSERPASLPCRSCSTAVSPSGAPLTGLKAALLPDHVLPAQSLRGPT